MQRGGHMRVVDLETVDRGAVGERRIGRTDLFASGEQRRGAAAAEARRKVAGDLSPRLHRAEKPTDDRVEQAQLEMRQHVGRDGGELQCGHPVPELPRDREGISCRVHPRAYLTVSLSSVSDSSAASSTMMPRPGPLGGTTWPSRTTKSVCGTSGSGPITPSPKMNSPAGITCAAGRLA